MARGSGGIFGNGLKGSVGGVTLYEQGGMLQVRERVRPRDPKTPAQIANRHRMDLVASVWATLDAEEHAAWVRFAESEGTPMVWNVFLGLTSKWMKLHPQALREGSTPPRLPPAGPFYGDNVVFSIDDSRLTIGGRAVAPGSEGGSTPLPHPPEEERLADSECAALHSSSRRTLPLQDEPLGEGVLTVLASQANAAGVATEIVVQRLPNARRKPRARDWTMAAVVVFTAESLAAEVELPLGTWAVGYRFVRPESGQATAMTFLGSRTVVAGSRMEP